MVPKCVRVLTAVIMAQPPIPPSLHYSKHLTVSAEMGSGCTWKGRIPGRRAPESGREGTPGTGGAPEDRMCSRLVQTEL